METGTPALPLDRSLRVNSRERIHIRTRESSVTLAAWRVVLDRGAIVLIELGSGSIYRAEGELIGSTQETLAALWQAALPPDEPPQDIPQLG